MLLVVLISVLVTWSFFNIKFRITTKGVEAVMPPFTYRISFSEIKAVKNSDTSFFQETLDGGYILAGSTNSYGAGLYYPWLTKTDANGNELWNRTINGTRDA